MVGKEHSDVSPSPSPSPIEEEEEEEEDFVSNLQVRDEFVEQHKQRITMILGRRTYVPSIQDQASKLPSLPVHSFLTANLTIIASGN
ncbi:hypothetical protein L1987_59053 [Smallanthus sonchifolius]|uniref:Uncharacterized protein n=1 Tax=Smallanthus sonchifolius TaxID=185202 RepID=A0ACB9D4H7_9ASTR|nr:hypothetical protein L1987_59053 [Smallanthus sonchifolius]